MRANRSLRRTPLLFATTRKGKHVEHGASTEIRVAHRHGSHARRIRFAGRSEVAIEGKFISAAYSRAAPFGKLRTAAKVLD